MVLTVLCSSAQASSPGEIDRAIQKAKEFIYTQRHGDTWEPGPQQPIVTTPVGMNIHATEAGQYGGTTALTAYALLAGGESPNDSRLAPTIKWCENFDFKGTYALGMKTQLYGYLPSTPDRRHAMTVDGNKFANAVIAQGDSKGLFNYLLLNDPVKRFDHSVSQYGVLGMWALERSGLEVPSKFWQVTENAWIRDQDISGGWCYERQPDEIHHISPAMTAAGVATLFITQDYLHQRDGVACAGNINNINIDRGMKWISDHFDETTTVIDNFSQPYYAIYAMERIGVASGLKYFGKRNWFDILSEYLIQHQRPDGAWGGNVICTDLGLIFLSRGRAPVVFNKLQYDLKGKPANWNQRPRDIANLTRWISGQTERDLNWQIVNLKAPVDEMQDAPILYIAGNENIKFTPDEIAKLKQYCEEGGLIIGQADCDKTNFSVAFRALGKELFPAYEFRELPPNHPIYTNQQYPRTKMRPVPNLLSLSNGVRELMILTHTGDAGKYWQLQDSAGHSSAFQVAADILLYAVDKQNLQVKGRRYQVAANSAMNPSRELPIARLEYTGNWDPEPAGWRRLANILHNNANINLKVQTVKLGENKLKGLKVAHLTGTEKVSFSAAERDEIKKFVNDGGTLIIDAAGGSTVFAQTVEAELNAIFGDAAAKLDDPLPPEAGIYNLNDGRIGSIDYRNFAKQQGLKKPQLRAIVINNRPAVFYSKQDLSAGLVGEPRDGIVGYDPDTCVAIMRNLIKFGAFGG